MKLYTIIASALIVISSTGVQAVEKPSEIEHLYLVGDASPAGWGRDAELTLQENGEYTWSGTLGTGELKLLTTTYNWDSFVSADRANCDLMLGVPMAMRFHSETESDDWKWNNVSAGVYDITVNLDELTIIVAPKQLYLVGNASPGQWGRDEVMERLPNGEYLWTGHLAGGEMKVALAADNWNSFVSAEHGHCDVRLNKPMPYKYCAAGDDDNDWKWNNTMAGEYAVRVNLVEQTITVSMDLDELYLVGTASTAGWDRGNAPALKKTQGDRLTWTGFMNSGNFKLLVSRTSNNWESIVPADCDGYGAVIGKPMNFDFNSGHDWKWNISEGVYTISVCMSDNTITVSPVTTPLYLVGDAAPEGWNRGDAPELVKDRNGLYVWEGYLKTGNFKFLLDRDRWDSFGANASSNPDILNNTPMSLKYNKDTDIQWNITTAGYYRLTVDLDNATMTAARLTALYLVGEAAPAGWDRSNAPQLKSADGNIYIWSGYLGLGQFKLIKARDSWDSYVSADYDNYGVQPGISMGMRDSGADNKWYNNYPGNYTITANISAGTLTVTPEQKGIVDPENMGFTLAQFELEQVADNLYRYCGNLTPGSYRVVFSDGSSLRTNGSATFEKTINHGAGSEFIVVDDTDRMQVFVHTQAGYVTFDTYTPADDLYAVGDFNDWELDSKYHFTASADGDTYEWEGDISVEKGGNFRIAAVTGSSRVDILPYAGGRDFSAIDHFYTGPVSGNVPEPTAIRAKAAAASDSSDWTLASDGKYKFSVNMFNREVSVSATPSITSVESAADERVKVFANNGILTIIAAESTPVAVFTPAGVCVARLTCTDRVDLSLNRGIYIVNTPLQVLKVRM